MKQREINGDAMETHYHIADLYANCIITIGIAIAIVLLVLLLIKVEDDVKEWWRKRKKN